VARPRTLRAILALPLDDREERLADRHIRRECARIRATWSEQEHRERAGLSPNPEAWEPPAADDGQR
jgi:hypothetical protein